MYKFYWHSNRDQNADRKLPISCGTYVRMCLHSENKQFTDGQCFLSELRGRIEIKSYFIQWKKGELCKFFLRQTIKKKWTKPCRCRYICHSVSVFQCFAITVRVRRDFPMIRPQIERKTEKSSHTHSAAFSSNAKFMCSRVCEPHKWRCILLLNAHARDPTEMNSS